jgi:hypothetical protein
MLGIAVPGEGPPGISYVHISTHLGSEAMSLRTPIYDKLLSILFSHFDGNLGTTGKMPQSAFPRSHRCGQSGLRGRTLM